MSIAALADDLYTELSPFQRSVFAQAFTVDPTTQRVTIHAWWSGIMEPPSKPLSIKAEIECLKKALLRRHYDDAFRAAVAAFERLCRQHAEPYPDCLPAVLDLLQGRICKIPWDFEISAADLARWVDSNMSVDNIAQELASKAESPPAPGHGRAWKRAWKRA